ncbi:MAG: RnfABCDGE type electron transport complex subunit B [Bacilli bacterium]|jgi:electron transport complex protein RnfB|nr:RnfABCDGE type electron transport complex subunit B [Bacilli bacterium]
MVAILTLACVGLAFGLILGFADKFCYVAPDTRVENINAHLPQVNCGACGFPGCHGLAEAIVRGDGEPENCKPIKPDQIALIHEIMDKGLESE